MADDFFRRPVAALDQHVGAAFEDAFDGRVFLEPGDKRNAFQRGDHCQPVGQRIDRAVVAFAQPPDRGVGVERDDHGGAQRPRLRQQGDVTAVQDVEAAVGEYQRTRQRRKRDGQAFRRNDLCLEVRRKDGGGHGHGGHGYGARG